MASTVPESILEFAVTDKLDKGVQAGLQARIASKLQEVTSDPEGIDPALSEYLATLVRAISSSLLSWRLRWFTTSVWLLWCARLDYRCNFTHWAVFLLLLT